MANINGYNTDQYSLYTLTKYCSDNKGCISPPPQKRFLVDGENIIDLVRKRKNILKDEKFKTGNRGKYLLFYTKYHVAHSDPCI